MLQIDAVKDPYSQNVKSRAVIGPDTEMEESEEYVNVLDKVVPSQQESLECENIPDPMEGEQTWPTEEELAEAETDVKKKKVKKVPKGTSEYQASWIVDSEDDESQLDEESDDEMKAIDEDEDESSSLSNTKLPNFVFERSNRRDKWAEKQ